MSKLNRVSLLWFMHPNDSLERSVELALDAWDRRPETTDVVPEYVEFSMKDQEKILEKLGEDKSICGLLVEFSKKVTPKHLKISGEIF